MSASNGHGPLKRPESPLGLAIVRECRGGPLTDDELAARLGTSRALVRQELAHLFFEAKDVDPRRPVDCRPDGRWVAR